MKQRSVLPSVQVDKGNPEVPQGTVNGLELDALGTGPGYEDEHVLIGAPKSVVAAAETSDEITPEEQEEIDRAMFKTWFTPSSVRQQTSLLQWQRLFAAWFAHLPVSPGINDCVRYVRATTKYRVGADAIRTLMARQDWQRMVVSFRESEPKRARELLNADHQTYVDAHREGLNLALAAGDYRAVPPFTVPMLDRVAPKREEETERRPTIVINIAGSAGLELGKVTQGALREADIIDAEVIEITEDKETP